MDVKALPQHSTDAERDAVDAVLGPDHLGAPPVPASEAKARRTQVLPVLHAVQNRVGWVSPGALAYAAKRLGLPPAELYGVASFYALFSLKKRPAAFAHVCDDIACAAKGGEALCASLEQRIGPGAHSHRKTESGADAGSTWARSPCLGLCDQAPAALVTRAGKAPSAVSFGHATTETVISSLTGDDPSLALPATGHLGERRLLRRVGVASPTSLDDYRAHGGYEALRRALELGPERVIREVTDAKLMGRGGAAFPTGRKWDAVANAAGRTKFIVCNADESEPGTFKDRVLLEEDPFAIIEAMTIAGLATGAERGLLYLRGEYPLAKRRLENALAQARSRGLLGADIMSRGLRFELELRLGAGAYICGEETALFASIEGFRGEPRSKPPFPVNVGVFGKPTAINNVETLAAVLDIVRLGAAQYAALGTPSSPGTKLFCVSGSVKTPGVYEVPFGTTLSRVIALAGGSERPVRAVLLGGAAGTFLGAAELELPLTFEDTRKVGATLGSGVVFVLDDSVPLLPVLRRIAAFFRDESCGQCVPCRVGTVRQEELLARIANGATPESELTLFKDLSAVMRDASICGLGQTAASAIESAFGKAAALGGLR